MDHCGDWTLIRRFVSNWDEHSDTVSRGSCQVTPVWCVSWYVSCWNCVCVWCMWYVPSANGQFVLDSIVLDVIACVGCGGCTSPKPSLIVQSATRAESLSSDLLPLSPTESVSEPADSLSLFEISALLSLFVTFGQGNWLLPLTNSWTAFIVNVISPSWRPKSAQYASWI